MIGQRVVDAAYFFDAYRASLQDAGLGVVEIFFAVFGHHPMWLKRVLVARNSIARWCGLEAPTRSEIMVLSMRPPYAIGDKIGPWPLFNLTDNELVAGRDNKHLDFRLSVFKEPRGATTDVVVSTICTTHNAFGRLYLFFIIPFHKWGVRYLIARAIAAGRI